jgi:DNA (cytosine-5)-methyltransferase 1
MERITAVSAFSGIGGMDLGLKGGFTFLDRKYARRSVDIVYSIDNYREACNIYEANFNERCSCADIREVPSSSIPDHDLLIAGFPCQSFSIVAQYPPRLGFESREGKIFYEIVRILRDKQPKAFIVENVKGIISANKGKAFPLILKEFSDAGYTVGSKLMNAAEWGIPQKRERVFIIGIRKDLGVQPSFPSPKKRTRLVPLKKVIMDHESVDKKYYFSNRAVEGLLKSNPRMNKGRVQNVDEPSSTVTSHLAKVSLNSVDPVLKVNGVFRRFTPREVARIQSFPENFKLVGTDFHQYKGLGNAVPPVLMWHIAREVLDILKGEVRDTPVQYAQKLH